MIYDTKHTTLKKLLLYSKDELDARERLINMCFGIGMKQASLFLRNVNYTRRLAILDSHVVRFMSKMDLYHCDTPITKKRYLCAEKALKKYSDSLNRDPAILDIAIWVVMKVAKEEFQWA